MESLNTVGSGDPGYYLPRRTLIEWLNKEFQCSFSKVEQCGNGAMYLQILDKSFTGRVPMARVNWAATTEYEIRKNYKILQEALEKVRLHRGFEMERLAKGRMQDNLEFLQWMKMVWERTEASKNESYKALERRQQGIGPLPDWALPGGVQVTGHTKAENIAQQRSESLSGINHTRVGSNRPPMLARGGGGGPRRGGGGGVAGGVPGGSGNLIRRADDRRPQPAPISGSDNEGALTGVERVTTLDKSLKDLGGKLEEVQQSLSEAITSRDFYYNKLTAIEALLQFSMSATDPVKIQLMEILYAPNLVTVEYSDETECAAVSTGAGSAGETNCA